VKEIKPITDQQREEVLKERAKFQPKKE